MMTDKPQNNDDFMLDYSLSEVCIASNNVVIVWSWTIFTQVVTPLFP